MWDLIVSVPDHCLSFYFRECTCDAGSVKLICILGLGYSRLSV